MQPKMVSKNAMKVNISHSFVLLFDKKTKKLKKPKFLRKKLCVFICIKTFHFEYIIKKIEKLVDF